MPNNEINYDLFRYNVYLHSYRWKIRIPGLDTGGEGSSVGLRFYKAHFSTECLCIFHLTIIESNDKLSHSENKYSEKRVCFSIDSGKYFNDFSTRRNNKRVIYKKGKNYFKMHTLIKNKQININNITILC